MERDLEIPKTIDEMREVVSEWINDRPTLRHTTESLQKIMYSEINELNRAVAEGETKDRVTSEVGDVLFSLLSIETITGPRYSEQIASISKYCEENMTTTSELFDKTWWKNSVNYPVVLFNEMSPFASSKDAIVCLRILRHSTQDNPKTLSEFWQYTEHLVYDGTSFFDGWVATGKLRSAIKGRLNSIYKSQSGGVSAETRIQIERLIKIGEWSMKPLNIPGNRFIWHL